MNWLNSLSWQRAVTGLGLVSAGLVSGWMLHVVAAEPAPKPAVFELRVYTTEPGRLPALHQRFANHTMKLFEKHGMSNVIYTTPVGEDNKLIYLLAHDSEEAAKASFNAFRNDPDWVAARDASEKDGKIVAKLESTYLIPTPYSPMKTKPAPVAAK